MAHARPDVLPNRVTRQCSKVNAAVGHDNLRGIPMNGPQVARAWYGKAGRAGRRPQSCCQALISGSVKNVFVCPIA